MVIADIRALELDLGALLRGAMDEQLIPTSPASSSPAS
jgi:hypothetical protein